MKRIFIIFCIFLYLNQVLSKSTTPNQNQEKELKRIARSASDNEEEEDEDESNDSDEDESDDDDEDEEENDYKSELQVGQCLKNSEMLTSPNGCFILIFQINGNLKLYRKSNRKALWSRNIHSKCSTKACLRMDANLIIYNCRNESLWETGSYGENLPFVNLKLQNDGNLVIYAYETKKAIWASNTLSVC